MRVLAASMASTYLNRSSSASSRASRAFSRALVGPVGFRTGGGNGGGAPARICDGGAPEYARV